VTGKAQAYREKLRQLEGFEAWKKVLLDESALPGPRANLELVTAAVEEGTAELFLDLLAAAPASDRAGRGAVEEGELLGGPVDSDPRLEFLAVCGAAGLGRLVGDGERRLLPRLRDLAVDERWRVREGVAMGLQRWGDRDPSGLLEEMEQWSNGHLLEQRAVVAGLCEPRLLRSPRVSRRVLELLDSITQNLVDVSDRRCEPFRILRKGLAYGWSVAVVADLQAGLPLMERWLTADDGDIRWLMRQNLSKARLRRAAPEWVASWLERLG
jgi:hypothetical protein